MKKYLVPITVAAFIFVFIQFPAYSQSPTESISETVDQGVQELKDKVAEKVEELKDQKKQAVSGVVQEMTDGAISILNSDSEKVEVEVDDTLTSFYEVVGSKIKEITLDDISKGEYIFITGPEIGETVTANAVYKDTQYLVMSGKITEVNKDDFTIKIVTVDKSNYVLDIEKRTDQNLLDIKTLETDSIGFSKIKEGDAIHVVVEGDPEKPDQTRFTAIKFLIIPNEYFLQ
ncbi:MAG: hypothetical protein US54_C0070G0004 [Candidatus Roizmanbacteria bacterium GW2011_GWA2_37_7]|uniref:DUF5666 domain-containing protein n=1 Tax=Candidatus Roizmanbacteria bacterium GW2011_GWA2_37_7 TaxID=1618481 RepID=A0A0G0HCW9_9BACT|nr:MAG: hypothetical protein US54_C0070G0004 [Candidatus Roizmanbacteria bacterium GW2011_GWA2_37_7]